MKIGLLVDNCVQNKYTSSNYDFPNVSHAILIHALVHRFLPLSSSRKILVVPKYPVLRNALKANQSE